MFWFEYRYTESFEIFKNIKKFLDYWITEWIFLSVWIIFIFSMTFYVIPKIKIYLKQSLKEKERNQLSFFLVLHFALLLLCFLPFY